MSWGRRRQSRVLTNAVLAAAVVLVACERSHDKTVAPRAVLSASNAEANSKVPTLPAPSEVAFGATSVQFFVPEGMVSSARPPFVLVLHGSAPSERCEPTDPVGVLEIHGDRDSIVPFDGGHLSGRNELPSTPSSLRVWAEKAQYAGELLPLQSFDFIAELPGNDTESFRFSSCRASSPLLWRVKGGQHVIPLGEAALGAIWDFLTAQGRPDARGALIFVSRHLSMTVQAT